MGSVFREENILVEEFWSRRGVFHLMEEVCSNGHLEVFKWIMSNLFQINEGNKLMTGDLLLVSAHKGQFLILKWLIETFGLDHFATSMCLGTSFRAKNGVYDLKSLVLTFPQWDFSSSWNLAISAGLARFSSADDIINVCQWLQDKFAFDGFVFTSWDKLPQHPKVIKWALSNVTDEYSLGDVWNLSCRQIGDIDLGKWFIEEKGIIPIPDNFISACSSKFSRVSFVEWLFKHVSLSSADLLSALHKALVAQSDRISKWLEDRYISTTNTRPKVSLFKLCLDCRYPLEEWFQWLFTHSSSCDIDCSESELVKIMSLTGTSKCKLCTAIFVWNKFSLSPVIHHDILVKLLDDVISYGTFSQVQQVFSLGEFSQSELEHISDTAVLESGKIAKWLVSSLAQNGNEPSALPSRKPPNLARIFVELLGKNKRGSAKWLFNKFHITLADVIVETKKPKATLSATVDLATWKLMLRLFPEITGNVARIHFIEIIAGSPLHAQFTSEKLGVSLNEIAQWCRDSGYSYSDTLWWIDWKNSNKKGS
ncbi:hypothetical protein Pelo_11302 [Pelomyxa schiedti]|nr:hypothetical protein Pelo_11302 [Pelomyxa schiedti]